jgi:uncharacterized delta-60 repeat protein
MSNPIEQNLGFRVRGLFLACLFLALNACGGGGETDAPPASPPPATTGPAGGTVTGPNGAKIVIPAGALTANTAIRIEQSSVGAPLLPNLVAIGDMFAFTPHGTIFSAPVTITLPFDPARVTAGTSPALYKTNAQGQWEKVTNATFDATSVTAQLTSFSFASVVLEPLTVGEPLRNWRFYGVRESGFLEEVGPPSPHQAGGTVSEHVNFGGADFDLTIPTLTGDIPADHLATGYVFGTADGKTYGAYTEAPNTFPGSGEFIGSRVEFTQHQTFMKNTPGATLDFTVTHAAGSATDANQFTLLTSDTTITSMVTLDVRAHVILGPVFYEAFGGARVKGSYDDWDIRTFGSYPRISLWVPDNFDIAREMNAPPDVFSRGSFGLRSPKFHNVDLSSVNVGERFTLTSTVVVTAINRRGGGPGFERISSASAYLRDPLEIGGPTIAFTGLTMVEADQTPPLAAGPVEPAACVPGPGPDPAAGVIQFNAAEFARGEFEGEATVVEIVRSGGTSGAVTATLRTSDGTAVAGADYTPANVTVSFADGDDTPRFIEVPILFDAVIEPDETVNLSLSQPGGCGALGPQASAVLTIQDDDTPPPVIVPPLPSFSIGGTVNGLMGAGLVLHHETQAEDLAASNGAFIFVNPIRSGLEYNVVVRTQPGNPTQVCSVTNGSGTVADAVVTNVVVNCAAPVDSGALDATFGGSGRVTSTLAGGAVALALQSDGKILTLGEQRLARFEGDGRPDTTFGTNGEVTVDFPGSSDAAQDLAIQSDGRIVVVGATRINGTDDFAAARYLTNGGIDTSFGNGGFASVDFNAGIDNAWAVLIQGDGRIVLAGHAAVTTTPELNHDFAAARLTSAGVLDATFGAAGKVTTNIAGRTDMAFAAALQDDGRIVLGGRVADSGGDHTDFGLLRYTSNGVLDATFGNGGTVRMNTSLNNFSDQIEELAIRSDGKILAAGFATVASNAQFGNSKAFALAQFEADGGADPSFGTGGVVTTLFSSLDDFGRSVALQGDGKIVVVGQTANQTLRDFAAARYLPNGSLDPSFDGDGMLTVDFFGAGDTAKDVAIQPDGRIVVGGSATNGVSVGLGLVRINP